MASPSIVTAGPMLACPVVGVGGVGASSNFSVGSFPGIMPVMAGPGEPQQPATQTMLAGVRDRFALEAPMFSTWFHDFMMGGSGTSTITAPLIFSQDWVDELIDTIGSDELEIEVGFAPEIGQCSQV